MPRARTDRLDLLRVNSEHASLVEAVVPDLEKFMFRTIHDREAATPVKVLLPVISATTFVAMIACLAWFSTGVLLLLDLPAVAIGISLFGVPSALALIAIRG